MTLGHSHLSITFSLFSFLNILTKYLRLFCMPAATSILDYGGSLVNLHTGLRTMFIDSYIVNAIITLQPKKEYPETPD